MVFSPEKDHKRQLISSRDNDDDIEFMNGIYTPSEDADIFLKDNQRWMHMYELSTIELCGDLANKIMDDEMPKIIKGFSLNNDKYMMNRPENNNVKINNNINNTESDDEDNQSKKSKKSIKSRKSRKSIVNENNNINKEENNIKENNVNESEEKESKKDKEKDKEEDKEDNNNKQGDNKTIKEEENEEDNDEK